MNLCVARGDNCCIFLVIADQDVTRTSDEKQRKKDEDNDCARFFFVSVARAAC